MASKTAPLLLMLDYDGTLTPIVRNYEEAQITPEGIETLRKLSQQPGICLAIVSGRSVIQLLRFLSGLTGASLYLVGLHGGEVYSMASRSYLQSPSPEYKVSITTLKNYLLQHKTDTLPGIMLEDKGYSLGVHYNQATNDVACVALDRLKQGMEHLGLSMAFILRPGKKLLEAVPKGFNKGVGVSELITLALKDFGEVPSLLYIGDDITDFDAFRVVNAHYGQSIYVGANLPDEAPPVSSILPDVGAVYAYLNQSLL